MLAVESSLPEGVTLREATSKADLTRIAAMESGCIAYLTKPFTGRSLIEPIERAYTRAA